MQNESHRKNPLEQLSQETVGHTDYMRWDACLFLVFLGRNCH